VDSALGAMRVTLVLPIVLAAASTGYASVDPSSCSPGAKAGDAHLTDMALQDLDEEEDDDSVQLQLGRFKVSSKVEKAWSAQDDAMQILNDKHSGAHRFYLQMLGLTQLRGVMALPPVAEVGLWFFIAFFFCAPLACYCLMFARKAPPERITRPRKMLAGKWMVLLENGPGRVSFFAFLDQGDAINFFRSGPVNQHRIIFAPQEDSHVEFCSFGAHPQAKDMIRAWSHQKVNYMLPNAFMVVICTSYPGGDVSMFPFDSHPQARNFLSTFQCASGILYDFNDEEIYVQEGTEPFRLGIIRKHVDPNSNCSC